MLTFIDLFAGIGGIRMAFERASGKCVFTSEWNTYAQKTYIANFGEIPFGDITKIEAKDIPSFDILAAGFPCQPFSIAGVSKKNSLNRKHGFDDEAQGTLFFDIVRILKHHKPKAFLLENVKNLQAHDGGRTFSVIHKNLLELGYNVFYKVFNAKNLVPQNRERIFIVGFLDHSIDFSFPEIKDQKPKLKDILQKNVDAKYTLTDKLWNYLKGYKEKHNKMGNGFGYSIADPESFTRTLSARYNKDGSEILIGQSGKNPRRLTPRECARLQGFPDNFKIPVSDTQAYKQFGNSVAVPLVEYIAKSVTAAMRKRPTTVTVIKTRFIEKNNAVMAAA